MTSQSKPPFVFGSENWPGLAKLVEEMGELQQVLGKLIMTGGDTNYFDGADLEERLIEEVADVQAALSVFVELNIIIRHRVEIEARTRMKMELFQKWGSSK